ncbi:hypothetical protein QYF61_013976 [Mycteria americana]|uniref:Uncharacterized protein n=1 Tax=Mycteria americana TaxID=33587 RepID=A0AAN7NA46_MYCAM|nr:hypothetical protein QYF61_013976 [Mycteria americana]
MEQILLEDISKPMEEREVIRGSQQGFTKANVPGLSGGLLPWSNCISGQGKSYNITYLGFCMSFDMVPHNILAAILDRHGFDGWTVRWRRKWLAEHMQTVSWFRPSQQLNTTQLLAHSHPPVGWGRESEEQK